MSMMQLTCPTSIHDKKYTGECLKKSLVPVPKVLSSSTRDVVSEMPKSSHSCIINYNNGLDSPIADTVDIAENTRTYGLWTAVLSS